MNETIKKQILGIRDTGLTNMFDTNMVQRLAYERNFYELVVFIEEHRKEYVHFILYGEVDVQCKCKKVQRGKKRVTQRGNSSKMVVARPTKRRSPNEPLPTS